MYVVLLAQSIKNVDRGSLSLPLSRSLSSLSLSLSLST